MSRRTSSIILGLGLALATVMFGIRAAYAPSVRIVIAGALMAAIALPAWRLGRRALAAGTPELRQLVVSGALLVLPWALFPLLAGYGRPDQATHAENRARYAVLLVNAVAVAGGLLLLADALRRGGQRLAATLGAVAIAVATPVYVVWAALMLQFHRMLPQLPPGELPPWFRALDGFSDLLLFFGGALTYAAALAFAAAAGRAGMLNRGAARAQTVAAMVALACLAVRGVGFPDPGEVFRHWYLVPGWAAGIPAVPWILPCLLGVALLRSADAGEERRS